MIKSFVLYIYNAVWRFSSNWFDLALANIFSWSCESLSIFALSRPIQFTHVPTFPLSAEVRERSLSCVNMITYLEVAIVLRFQCLIELIVHGWALIFHLNILV